uniref:DUF6166 domain-containing protein n=2 Tax=Thiolapillus sp. TaxID=2017437 RepID=UPI003AF96E02
MSNQVLYVGAPGGSVFKQNGEPLNPRFDLANKSPTGFSWGYRGSGPAQLALAILADYLRDEQACLRPRDRFWDIPVPKIDSAFDNLLVPQPSWSPSTT